MTRAPASVWARKTPYVGETAKRSRFIENEYIRLFTEISGDRNPLHYDESAASKSRFGEIVVQGGVTTAILNAVVAEDLPGPGTVFLHVDSRVLEHRAQSHVDPRRGAEAPPLHHLQIAARRAEIRVHHQEPVHPLRLRAEQLHAVPLRKCRERRVRRAADEVDRAVAERAVRRVDRKEQLDLDVEPLGLEEAELHRRDDREVRR